LQRYPKAGEGLPQGKITATGSQLSLKAIECEAVEFHLLTGILMRNLLILAQQLPVIILLLMVAGCGSKPTTEPSGPLINRPLKIFTYGDRKEIDTKLRLMHGRELSADIATRNWFSSAEYVGDSRDIAGFDTTLRITFVFVHQGQRQWPLEIKAHYQLEDQRNILFNEVFEIKATQFNAQKHCPGCSAEQTALKMLSEQVMTEINNKLTTR
jgi:hypothetical protein